MTKSEGSSPDGGRGCAEEGSGGVKRLVELAAVEGYRGSGVGSRVGEVRLEEGCLGSGLGLLKAERRDMRFMTEGRDMRTIRTE